MISEQTFIFLSESDSEFMFAGQLRQFRVKLLLTKSNWRFENITIFYQFDEAADTSTGRGRFGLSCGFQRPILSHPQAWRIRR
ncbi:MAG: hypothetical protein LBR29_11605 [Methylobacteriaceae bacterium]|jgi:hypothetical protein|nr:hypothetical protein [Methylobacteriaceae bacterium]